MSKRRAPKGGYGFKEKELYRHRVWTELKKHSPVKPCLANALLMPSLEGLEINVALKMGFREENLHVVDMNPAIVATLKRRYPKIQTYGVTVERACERIASEGKVLHVANFDFTSCAGLEFLDALTLVRESGAISHRGTVAVTLLRGRETFLKYDVDLPNRLEADGFNVALKRTHQRLSAKCSGEYELTHFDSMRIGFAAEVMRARTEPSRIGIYRSNTQTMLWIVFCSNLNLQLKGPSADVVSAKASVTRAKKSLNSAEFASFVCLCRLSTLLTLREQWRDRNA